MTIQSIIPFLWFDKQAEEAVEFYLSVFKNSKILNVSRYDQAGAKASGMHEGMAMVVSFELDGQKFNALNGGPAFKFNEAISFAVECEDQKEIDYFWKKLSAHPQSEQCGWLKDKFGLSWQILPKRLGELIRSEKGMQAMLKMKKIEIKKLEEANGK